MISFAIVASSEPSSWDHSTLPRNMMPKYPPFSNYFPPDKAQPMLNAFSSMVGWTVTTHIIHSFGAGQTVCLDISHLAAHSFDAEQTIYMDTSHSATHSFYARWAEVGLQIHHFLLSHTSSEGVIPANKPPHAIFQAMVLATAPHISLKRL